MPYTADFTLARAGTHYFAQKSNGQLSKKQITVRRIQNDFFRAVCQTTAFSPSRLRYLPIEMMPPKTPNIMPTKM